MFVNEGERILPADNCLERPWAAPEDGDHATPGTDAAQARGQAPRADARLHERQGLPRRALLERLLGAIGDGTEIRPPGRR